MKQYLLKTFLVALFFITATGASAHDFEVDGIYYNITYGVKTVEVTNGENEYTGSVVIPSAVTYNSVAYSVTSIGDSAFGYCSALTSITIPNSVTSIGDYAFDNCSGLTSVTIPNSVTSIGDYAFMACYGLTSIVIPNSVIYIGRSAFDDCNGLTGITIGNSVRNIGDMAFQFCNGLTNIEIPASVTSIGNSAFRYCSALTSIVVDEGNSVYDSREGCNAIIETATNTLVQGCKNTIIPNGVTSIGVRAFCECAPGNVTIPSSVTSIGDYAFAYSWWLTDIYFASNPTIGSNAIPSTATCHLTLTDSDAADFNTANANTYADVSYTRTISEGKYGTIMLPFAPDEASLQNYAFYTLKEAGDGYVKFEDVAAPEANTPYLYTLREGMWNLAITGGETTIAAGINNCNVDGWEFVGSFTNQTIDCTGGNYYALSPAENKINRITKTLTVLPYRAYFKSTVAQNSNLRVFIGGTTGVTEISPDDIEGLGSGAIYDLYGRPVSEPAKGGVYIINGKKVVW